MNNGVDYFFVFQARGLLVIEEDMVLIRPDGELRFKYTCFDCIEVQFHFFAKDSKSCDKIRYCGAFSNQVPMNAS